MLKTIEFMLQELRRSGMTQVEIARYLGISQSTVHRAMMNGADVSYRVGKMVEELYEGRCAPGEVGVA